MHTPKQKETDLIFFGTPHYAVFVLEELEKVGILPSLIITAPDKPQGRGLALSASPVKRWAENHNIPLQQPEKLDAEFAQELRTHCANRNSLFVVAAYGKIIPQEVLDISKHSTLNIHPSLLPKYRGPSPLEAPLLNDDTQTGVTIMELDEKMDHGPILEQKEVETKDKNKEQLGEELFRLGGQMLGDIMQKWVNGALTPTEQDHAKATYTHKITKKDGEIVLNDDAETNWRKYRAYTGWPGTFFFITKNGTNIRVKITDAELVDKKFVIKRVIPEGKKEMAFESFNI